MRTPCPFILLIAVLIVPGHPGPVPTTEEPPKDSENEIEAHEEGLVLLVPTLPADAKGNPTKREIEYDLIAIPAEVLKREIRSVIQTYRDQQRGGQSQGYTSASSSGSGSSSNSPPVFITSMSSPSQGYGITNDTSKTFNDTADLLNFLDLYTAEQTEGTFLNLLVANDEYKRKPQRHHQSYQHYNNYPSGATSTATATPTFDLAQLISGLTVKAGQAINTGLSIANTASGTVGQIGQIGPDLLRWLLQQKASGLSTAADFATNGLAYAGRLSSSVLRILLQVPAIKVRVLSEIIQASQPLAKVISDVIADSSDDFADIVENNTEIFRDTVDIILRLIRDVLALKGKILASLGGSGLDIGASIINAGIRIGGALVQTAGGVAGAVGKGVGDVVQVVSEVEFPPLPALPVIRLPQLVIPQQQGYDYQPPKQQNLYRAPN